MEEYNRKPYLSSNYKKKNVVKHSSEWVPLTAGLPNGWYEIYYHLKDNLIIKQIR
jgi:hypothetical protein